MTYHGGKIGRKRRKPVLIDVDGVVSNFHKKVVSFIEDKFDIKVDESKIYGDVRNEANGLWDQECEDYIRSPGFSRYLEAWPGSIEAIKKIMKKKEVMFVTSPYNSSPTWAYDRTMWLKDHFGITRDDVIFARDKRFVDGVTLIDDRWENVVDWSRYRGKWSILMKRPWNVKDLKNATKVGGRSYVYDQDGENQAMFFACDDWNQISAHIETFGE